MPWHVPVLIPLTDHFHMLEAVCRHCGRIPDRGVIEATAAWMEEVREVLGNRPLHVNSWARCPIHNQNVGGAPGSMHLEGLAVDFTHRDLSPRKVQKILKEHQGKGKLIGGLGLYPAFTHVDRGKPRRWNGP